MTISSHIEGRLRVRDPRLRNAGFLQMLQEKLQCLHGVSAVSGSPRSGSLLVLYRQAQLPLEKIDHLLTELLGSGQNERPEPRPKPADEAPRSLPELPLSLNRRQAVNWSMLLCLLLSLGALAVGSKRIHIIAGTVFVGILGLHLFDKRKAFVA